MKASKWLNAKGLWSKVVRHQQVSGIALAGFESLPRYFRIRASWGMASWGRLAESADCPFFVPMDSHVNTRCEPPGSIL